MSVLPFLIAFGQFLSVSLRSTFLLQACLVPIWRDRFCQQNPPTLWHGMTCHSYPHPTHIELLCWQCLGQHVWPVLLHVDLCQRKFFIIYPLPNPVISPLDVLGPIVVSRILCKVDGTFTVAVKPKLLLSDSYPSDEVLYRDYFHAIFYNLHILRFHG